MDVVVIPAYEPDVALCEIVSKLWELGLAIVVVDDGSGESFRPVFDSIKDISTVLCNDQNYGKGVAIRTALSYIQDEMSDCEFVGVMDADGQHLPEDMVKVLREAKQYPEAFILGVRRFGKDTPLRSRMGNWITSRVFRMITGVGVTDTQTGLRAFHRDMLQVLLETQGARYEYEMNVLVRLAKQGTVIREVPIHTIYRDQMNSTSHFRAFTDSVRIYRDLLQFTMISLSSFLLDYVLFLLFVHFLGEPFGSVLIANITARFVSAAYNYSMNCRWVFHRSPDVQSALQYFALACAILLTNNLILEILSQGIGLPVAVAKIITELTLFAGSWIVQRYCIFMKEKKQQIAINNYSDKKGEMGHA